MDRIRVIYQNRFGINSITPVKSKQAEYRVAGVVELVQSRFNVGENQARKRLVSAGFLPNKMLHRRVI